MLTIDQNALAAVSLITFMAKVEVWCDLDEIIPWLEEQKSRAHEDHQKAFFQAAIDYTNAEILL